MKWVVFDHNVPARLSRLLKAFDIKLARELGWEELRNGKLLRAAEREGFHVLLTGDQRIPREQNMNGCQIGVVVLSANNWRIVQDHVPAIIEAIEGVKAGGMLPWYGRFVPKRFQ